MPTREMNYRLNENEEKVLGAFPKLDEGEAKWISLEDLAQAAFKSKYDGRGERRKQAGSWVRNSLRKLVRLGLVKLKGMKSGEYARTKLSLDDVIKEAHEKHAKAVSRRSKATEKKTEKKAEKKTEKKAA